MIDLTKHIRVRAKDPFTLVCALRRMMRLLRLLLIFVAAIVLPLTVVAIAISTTYVPIILIPSGLVSFVIKRPRSSNACLIYSRLPTFLKLKSILIEY